MADHSDDFFYQFINDINKCLKENENGTDQKKQVETLLKVERQFKKAIWKYPVQTREAYKKFLLKNVVEDRNILGVRPYFRERSVRFNTEISPLIKTGKIDKLKKFHINFKMMKYIRDNWAGAFPEECEKLYHDTIHARKMLIENNLPLVINRAKLFHRKVPESHLSLVDMINIAASGLVDGIDKFADKSYSKVFRSVCIGRMSSNMMEDYSNTLIYFYPSDRQLLYRINMVKKKTQLTDPVELTKAVNASFEEDRKNNKKTPKKSITVSELVLLIQASNVLSEVATTDDGENTVSLFDTYSKFENDGETEQRIADRQAMISMLRSIQALSMRERKLLKLKGIKS